MENSSQLNAATSGGTQASTQNPQNSVQTSGLGQQNGNVQSGIQSSDLEMQSGGIPLYASPLPAFNLNAPIASTVASSTPTPHHSPNPVLLVSSGVLLVIAVVLFWSTSRSEKNTTK